MIHISKYLSFIIEISFAHYQGWDLHAVYVILGLPIEQSSVTGDKCTQSTSVAKESIQVL